MSYGVAYEATIDTYRSDPAVVSLLKEGYGGSASPMRLASTPIEEQASTGDADELVPLRPRKGALRLHASQGHVVEDIYADDTSWRIQIEIGGQLDVVGPVRKHLRTRSDDRFSTDALELKWTDGIGQLQEKDFRAADGSRYEDRRSIVGWITELLRKTGLGLDVAVASEWYTPSMNGSVCPLEQEYLGPGRFAEDGGVMSCFEVLEDLVKNKGAVLAQERGRWHVYQRSLFRKDTFDRWVYPSGWSDGDAHPSAEAYTSYVDVGSAYKERLSGSKRPTRKAFSAVEVTYKHQSINNLLPPYYETDWSGKDLIWDIDDFFEPFSPWNPTSPPDGSGNVPEDAKEYDGWMFGPKEDYDSGKTVSETLTQRAQSPSSLTERRVRLSMSVYAFFGGNDSVNEDDDYDTPFYVKVILDGDDGTTYYLRRQLRTNDEGGFEYEPVAWTKSDTDFVAVIAEPERETQVDLPSPDLPATGSVYVEIWGAIDMHPDDRAILQAVSFSHPTLLPIGDDGQAEAAVVTCRISAEDGEGVEMDVLHGTGPTSSHESATRVSADGGELIGDWKIGPYSDEDPSSLSAAQILAREGLYQLHAQREVLAWSLLDRRPSVTRAARLPNGRRYLPTHMSTDYKKGHQGVEAIRLRRDDSPSISFLARSGDSGGSGSGGSGGGSSGGGSGAQWPVSGTPDGLISTSGEGATLTPQNAVSSFRPGPVPQDSEVFSRLFISGFGVRGLTIFAGVGPAADYTFSVRLNGAEQATVTLAAGASSAEVSLSFSTTGGDRLSVVGADPRDDDLSDVHATFDISL
jgi:hypothetical protein